jgi:hypothetical protein
MLGRMPIVVAHEGEHMAVTASVDTLMRQAPITVAGYLSGAVKYIDAQFGKGYAEENPQLMAAFIRASAQDFHTAMMVKSAERGE